MIMLSLIWQHYLTHWGWVMHICVSKLTIIGSDNGLSPGRRQAIIWINAGILLIGPMGTNFSELLIEIYTVDSRYLAPVGSQNSRARVKWFSRYLALSREGHDSRIQDHRHTPGRLQLATVCWAIIQALTFPRSLHTSTSHQRQITTSNIRF